MEARKRVPSKAAKWCWCDSTHISSFQCLGETGRGGNGGSQGAHDKGIMRGGGMGGIAGEVHVHQQLVVPGGDREGRGPWGQRVLCEGMLVE